MIRYYDHESCDTCHLGPTTYHNPVVAEFWVIQCTGQKFYPRDVQVSWIPGGSLIDRPPSIIIFPYVSNAFRSFYYSPSQKPAVVHMCASYLALYYFSVCPCRMASNIERRPIFGQSLGELIASPREVPVVAQVQHIYLFIHRYLHTRLE